MLFSHLPQNNLRRDVKTFIGAMRVLMAVSILLIPACSYLTPFADLAIALEDAAEKDAVQSVLVNFAHQKKLKPYHPSEARSSKSDPPWLREKKSRMTHYVTGNRYARGFDFMVYEASPRCMVIRFSERGRAWTPQSLAALDELQRTLTRIVGDRVRLMTAPKDWKNAPGEMEEYCRHIGIN